MAERESQGFLAEAKGFVGGIYQAVMADGTIAAGVRQGFNELANAFGQAWPDQIAVTEPGTIFHPLHSDIATHNQTHSHAGERANVPLPSPSEIANEPAPSRMAESRTAQQGHSQQQSQGHEM